MNDKKPEPEPIEPPEPEIDAVPALDDAAPEPEVPAAPEVLVPEALSGPVWLIHRSSAGALWVNGVGEVEPGVPFLVGPELGTSLIEQVDLFSITEAPKGDAS